MSFNKQTGLEMSLNVMDPYIFSTPSYCLHLTLLFITPSYTSTKYHIRVCWLARLVDQQRHAKHIFHFVKLLYQYWSLWS